MKYRVITTAIPLLIIGITTLGYGVFSDPFNIPFQDFDQMPTSQQALYQSQNDTANRIRRGGITVSALGLITLITGTFMKASNPCSTTKQD
ncbi:MAG: hypothetical protein AAFY20_16340 [Cyanobacteria bacterium J06639_14]